MTETFTVVLRGYDRFQVEQVLAEADEALASGSETARAAISETLQKTRFGASLRGYAINEVDRAVQQRLRRLGGEQEPPPASSAAPKPTPGPTEFVVVLRGYEMTEVDRLLSQADEAQASASDSLRAGARAALKAAAFRQRFRGYSREQVDREIHRRLQDLQES